MTAPDPTIKRGDWRTLAQLNGVVGICPETTQQEAASLLVEHLADLILAKRGLPEGWTEEEYWNHRRQLWR